MSKAPSWFLNFAQAASYQCYQANTTASRTYEGLPISLAINFVSWILLLLLFLILRKYIFSRHRPSTDIQKQTLPPKGSTKPRGDYSVWTSLFASVEVNSNEAVVSSPQDDPSASATAAESRPPGAPVDTGFLSWIPAYIRLTDEQIHARLGDDALLYLRFQRYLILFATVVTAGAMFVAFPVNFFAGGKEGVEKFGRTTVSNIPVNSPWLWAHFGLAVLIYVFGYFIMRFYSTHTSVVDERTSPKSCTLMVVGIPARSALKPLIYQHFSEAYPACVITNVELAHDVGRLMRLDAQREESRAALAYYQKLSQRALDRAQLSSASATDDASQMPLVAQRDGSVMSEPKERACCTSSDDVQHPIIFPYHCSWLCQCSARACCCCPKFLCSYKQEDAVDFYSARVARLTREMDNERPHAYRLKLGIAFIVFERREMALAVLADLNPGSFGNVKREAHRANELLPLLERINEFRAPGTAHVHSDSCFSLCCCSRCICPRIMRGSSAFEELAVPDWDVRIAPSPNNIYWENLSATKVWWWVRVVTLNLLVLFIVLFISTPAVILQWLYRIPSGSIESWQIWLGSLPQVGTVMATYLPSLMLALFGAILPIIIAYTDELIGHWTRTAAHHATMRKSYLFLIFMVLLLPSLGLTSGAALIQWAILDSTTEKFVWKWSCMYLPGNGALFVSYVITSAFLSTTLDLLNFADLVMLLIAVMWARSSAERILAIQKTTKEFQYGYNFAWMLCIYSVFLVYSVVVPLIAPFGLLYIILKYLVDRYNIYYTNSPSRISRFMLRTGLNFYFIALSLLQLNVVVLICFKGNGITELLLFALIWIFFVTAMLLMIVWFPNFFPFLVPFQPPPSAPHILEAQPVEIFDVQTPTAQETTPEGWVFVPKLLQEPRPQDPFGEETDGLGFSGNGARTSQRRPLLGEREDGNMVNYGALKTPSDRS